MHKPMHIGSFVILILGWAALIPLTAHAADYYVAPNGDDTNPGTLAAPWRHIAYATCGGSYLCPIATNNSNKLKAGDTLYLRAGTYNESNIRFANSGTAESPIRVTAHPNETPTIDGQYTDGSGLSWGAVIFIDNNHYITLEGLTVRRGLRANVRIGYDYYPTNITIRNCDLSMFVASDNSGEITIVHGDNIIVEDNVLHGYQPYALDTSQSQNAAGVHIFYAGNVTIKNNTIVDTHSGIYYKGSVDNGSITKIENNLILDQKRWGVMSAKRGLLLRNNIIVTVAPGPGVRVFEESSSCDRLVSTDNRIDHNTIVNASTGILLDRSQACPGAVNTVVQDNLVADFQNNEHRGLSVYPYYGPPYGTGTDTSNTTFDHNMIYAAAYPSPIRILSNYYSAANAPLAGSGNIQQAPVFVDAANSDYTLAAASPGKNAASDGTDMGARICAVGPNPTCAGFGDSVAPAAPSNLTVQ